MDGSAVKAISELTPAQTFVVGGETYSDKPMHLIRPPLPTPECLQVSTLEATHIFANNEKDVSLLHVVSPTEVALYGEPNAKQIRPKLLVAKSPLRPFDSGQWMEQEPFIISLMTGFVQDAALLAMMNLASRITGDEIRTDTDTGYTQEVAVKAGAHFADRVDVPANGWILTPFRTFAEIEDQPASRFILRVRKGRQLELALFEFGPGFWKIEAMASIAAFFEGGLDGRITVLK